MPPSAAAPTQSPRRLGRFGLAAAATALTLVVLPVADAQAAVLSPTSTGSIGSTVLKVNDTRPVEAWPGASPLEYDQRQMSFGEVARNTIRVRKALPTDDTWCGDVVFGVTRYQNYGLTWEAPKGATNNILYRGGLIADSGRPYVGVFFVSGNKLEIRTYNRRVAYDRYGDPYPGAIFNSWTAASITVPQNRLSLEKNGLYSVNAAGVKSAWRTGGTGC